MPVPHVLSLLALLAAARPDTVPADTVREYQGWYTWGFERSQFIPCGAARGDGPWWVIPSETGLRQRDSLWTAMPAGVEKPVFVRVRGLAGARVPAGVGHLGGNSRYFRLYEVLDMRTAGSCAPPASA